MAGYYITLHYITSYHLTAPQARRRGRTLHYITLHYISEQATWCHTVSYDIMLYMPSCFRRIAFGGSPGTGHVVTYDAMMIHMASCAFEESRSAGSHHEIGHAMARDDTRYNMVPNRIRAARAALRHTPRHGTRHTPRCDAARHTQNAIRPATPSSSSRAARRRSTPRDATSTTAPRRR